MVSDSVLDYAMEGTDPLEVQNRLLSGIAGKRLYKMQTVSSEAVWAGTVDFDISLKKGEHGVATAEAAGADAGKGEKKF